MQSPLLLSAGFLALSLLLIAALARSTWPWPGKAILILVVLIASIAAWQALEREAGWPSAAPLPAEFQLLSSRIIEPNARQNDSGAIFLWAQDLSTDARPEPRAYRLPYSVGLHDEISRANRRGRPQQGRYRRPGTGAHEDSGGRIAFQDLTPAALPPKPAQ